MATWFTCPQGHQWSGAAESASPGKSVCPECGARGVGQTPLPANQETVDQPSLARPEPAAPCQDKTEIARFTVLGKHAQGGLGQIILARDEKLGRQVALKEIRPEHLDNPQARERFLNEARITGQLEHPGIVPIYTLEDGDGGPYYAMRFIQGMNLSDALVLYHRKPGTLAFRDLLKRFVDVCQTIAYAHSKKIIHRDLKPANIMLGDFGETLVVDWGLAKRLADAEGRIDNASHAADTAKTELYQRGEEAEARPAEAASAVDWLPAENPLTERGQMVGTLAYMAPEQARGDVDKIGPASDIYALGIILFEILTGQNPFKGKTRAEVLPRIQQGQIPRPAEVKRGVPKGLERICLKATAARPEERYRTAQDLAGDVQRWLADEPVSVHAGAWLERMARWARHHKPIVAGGVMLLITAVVALGIGLWVVGEERDEKEAARRQEAEQRQIAQERADWAQANFKRAGAAVDQLTEVGEHWLKDLPKMEPVRRQLLEKALEFHQQFLKEKSTDPAIRFQTGLAFQRVGRIYSLLGKHPAAHQAFQQGIELLEKLAEELPDKPEYRGAIAGTYAGLDRLLLETGKFAEGEEAWQKALALRLALVERYPQQPDYRINLASSFHARGLFFQHLGRHAEAEKAFQQAISHHEKVLAVSPDSRLARSNRGASYTALGNTLKPLGRLDEAEKAHDLARKEFDHLVAKHPAAAEHRLLATSNLNLAVVLQENGRLKEAEQALREALPVAKKLAADFPSELEPRHVLAAIQGELARLLENYPNRFGEAENLYRAAISLFEKLASENALVTDYRAGLAKTTANFAVLLTKQGRSAEAVKQYRQALTVHEKLVDDFSQLPKYQLELGRNLDNLANLLDDLDEAAEAEKLWRRAIRLLDDLVTRHPTVPEYRFVLGNSRSNLGTLLQKNGRLDEADAERRGALAHRKELVAKNPDLPDYRMHLGISYSNLGLICLQRQRLQEAGAALQHGRKLFDQLVSEFPKKPDYQKYRVKLVFAQSMYSVANGQLEKGLQTALEARKDGNALVQKYADVPEYQHILATVLAYLGTLQDRAGHKAEAKQALQDALKLEARLVQQYPKNAQYRSVHQGIQQDLARLDSPTGEPKTSIPQVLKGSLTADDPLDTFPFTRKSYHKVHTVSLEAGQPYWIDLKGSFDTFLRIEDADKKPLVFNDDVTPPDTLDSRIVFTPPGKGQYRLVVTSFKPADTGAYVIEVHEAVRAGAPVVIQEKLTTGDKNLKGRLFKTHLVKLAGGSPYTLELRSKEFDTFLVLLDATGKNLLVQNDDVVPGNKNLSRIDYTPRVDETLAIVVTSFDPGETGAYTLTVQRYEKKKNGK